MMLNKNRESAPHCYEERIKSFISGVLHKSSLIPRKNQGKKKVVNERKWQQVKKDEELDHERRTGNQEKIKKSNMHIQFLFLSYLESRNRL